MFELVKKLKNREANERLTRVSRYRELLERGDAATEEEQAEIASLAENLGKNATAIETDLRAIRDRKHSLSLQEQEPARERNYRALAAKQKKFADEVEATVNRLQAELHALTNERNNAERLWHESRRASNALGNLGLTHHELFGLPDPRVPVGPTIGYRPPQG